MNKKVEHGQFYTVGNCFKHAAFKEWWELVPEKSRLKVIEPFAGANNIIRLVDEAGVNIPHSSWFSYDIEPTAMGDNVVEDVPVHKADTLNKFPKGYKVAITNPPYLAKNSAKRKKIDFDFEGMSDMFEVSLKRMLDNVDYIAAIIPESFITRNILKERLWAVVSLNYDMFDDTDFPVCLALFVPEPTKNKYVIYVGDKKLGTYEKLETAKNKLFENNSSVKFKFNDKKGLIGLRGVDNTKKASIEFIDGNKINPDDIKVSSRAITRISPPKKLSKTQIAAIIVEANKILSEYRKTTGDVFMTSFKGLRDDGYYRRRLDFKIVNTILNKAADNLNIDLT